MCSIVGVFGVFGLLLSGICVVIALFTLAVVWGARLITPLSRCSGHVSRTGTMGTMGTNGALSRGGVYKVSDYVITSSCGVTANREHQSREQRGMHEM